MKLKVILPLFVLGGSLHGAISLKGDSAPIADFLYAIRQVESGDRYDGPAGRAGELGAYQFRRQVWAQHTHAPFSQARTALADEIALRHYYWISDRLKAEGIFPSPWLMAAAWNCGVTAVTSGHIPRSARDYAKRVQNLVESRAIPSHPALFPVQLVMTGTR